MIVRICVYRIKVIGGNINVMLSEPGFRGLKGLSLIGLLEMFVNKLFPSNCIILPNSGSEIETQRHRKHRDSQRNKPVPFNPYNPSKSRFRQTLQP
jgi:hypothetical protein